MPELPEVETMRRGVEPVVGRRIAKVARTRTKVKPIQITPSMRTFTRRAVGKKIEATGRVGKRLILHLSGGDRIVIEPRMTGLALLADPPDRGHLRFRMEFESPGDSPLLYWDRRGLGLIRLVDSKEFDERYGPEKVGPDALMISAGDLQSRLQATRRAVKVALLDQRLTAGVGNLYASELLHVARIHPARIGKGLSRLECARIHAATREVLLDAIDHEGSTLSDGTYRNALNQDGSYQNLHRVY
ncbi:MAG: formamidopyrimidine-DNA glycosylase, partial [Planctomycetales bacterium]